MAYVFVLMEHHLWENNMIQLTIQTWREMQTL